ncbi:MAG: tyrosine-protein phosphatase [Candidatus Obscuribacter sp.]|nr:tyrosine-protein phosphatase [Candidatus Obscuribacter sp.]
MITLVKALSRQHMESNLSEYLRAQNRIFISVVDCNASPVFGESERVLTVRFDDVSPEMFESQTVYERILSQMEELGRPYRTFTEEQARAILQFALPFHRLAEAVELFVHCTMGVSRSGAIASYLAELCQVDMQTFGRLNPQIVPNQLVLETFRAVNR